MIPFVPAVIAHFLSQQTGADPKPDLFDKDLLHQTRPSSLIHIKTIL
jgi:hypothetical protein